MKKNQGDVIAVKIDKMPKGLKKIKGSIVALGEHSGHTHGFYDDATMVVDKIYSKDVQTTKNVNLFEDEMHITYAEILSPVFLKHNEHDPIKFDPGLYKIGIVREFNYEEMESRRVVD